MINSFWRNSSIGTSNYKSIACRSCSEMNFNRSLNYAELIMQQCLRPDNVVCKLSLIAALLINLFHVSLHRKTPIDTAQLRFTTASTDAAVTLTFRKDICSSDISIKLTIITSRFLFPIDSDVFCDWPNHSFIYLFLNPNILTSK